MLELVKHSQEQNDDIAEEDPALVIIGCIGSVVGVCGAHQVLWEGSLPQG
jgi:hypothetical protein